MFSCRFSSCRLKENSGYHTDKGVPKAVSLLNIEFRPDLPRHHDAVKDAVKRYANSNFLPSWLLNPLPRVQGELIILKKLRETPMVMLMYCDGIGLRMLDGSSLPANRHVQVVSAHLSVYVC